MPPDALLPLLPLADLVDSVREAASYEKNLAPEDKSVVTTWIVFEGLARITYYALIFAAVFLLGRRIIQAMIAGYRESKAQSV